MIFEIHLSHYYPLGKRYLFKAIPAVFKLSILSFSSDSATFLISISISTMNLFSLEYIDFSTSNSGNS